MKLIALLLLITQALSMNFVKQINKERMSYNLSKITRDYEMEEKISNYSIDPHWYYNTSEDYKTYNYINGKYKRWNGDHIPQYINETDWDFLFRDRTSRSLDYIIWFRLNQRKCFDLRECSKTSFSDYLSCKKRGNFTTTPYKRCSWAWQYYPKMIEKDFKKIACVWLGKPPPNNKKGFYAEDKKNSFFCYGNKINSTNDFPLD